MRLESIYKDFSNNVMSGRRMRDPALGGKGKPKVGLLFSVCHDVQLMVYEVHWTFGFSRNTKV